MTKEYKTVNKLSYITWETHETKINELAKKGWKVIAVTDKAVFMERERQK